jgi:homoserine O-succinyltransferase
MAEARLQEQEFEEKCMTDPGDWDGAGNHPDSFEVALINAMPDSALAEAEEQFLGLLKQAASRRVVARTYALPGIERRGEAAERIRTHYRPWPELFRSRPELVVFTGAQPNCLNLADEAFWWDLVAALDWAAHSARAVVASCLAAHACLEHFDGVRRQRLRTKRSGLFANRVASDDPLTEAIPASVWVPHSRYNEAPTADLEKAGWRVIVSSRSASWSVAWSRKQKAIFLLTQGHPEYAGDTLLREYRRDIRRWLAGEAAEYPQLPTHYLDRTSALDLAGLEKLARQDADKAIKALSAFPFDRLKANLRPSWRSWAVRLYSNLVRFSTSMPQDEGARKLGPTAKRGSGHAR